MRMGDWAGWRGLAGFALVCAAVFGPGCVDGRPCRPEPLEPTLRGEALRPVLAPGTAVVGPAADAL